MNYYPHLGILLNNSNQLFWIAKSENGEVIALPIEGHNECVLMKNDFLELVFEVVYIPNFYEHLNYHVNLNYIGKDSPNAKFRISESPGCNTTFHMYDGIFAMLHGRHVFYSHGSHHVDISGFSLKAERALQQQRKENEYWSKKTWNKQTCLPDGHGSVQSSNYHELLYNKEQDIFKVVDFSPSYLTETPMKHFSSENARLDENGYFDYITPEGKSEPIDEPGFESLPYITCPTAKDAIKTYSEGWEPITKIFGRPTTEFLKKHVSI